MSVSAFVRLSAAGAATFAMLAGCAPADGGTTALSADPLAAAGSLAPSAALTPPAAGTGAVIPTVYARRVATAVPVTAAMFGVHPFGEVPQVPAGSYRLWGGIPVLWRDIQPTASADSSRWDWGPVDARVSAARAAGIKDLMFVFGGTPAWAAARPNSAGVWGPGTASTPTSWAAFTRFVAAVVTRYRGRITSYQAWNEISEPTSFNGTVSEAARLTRIVYDTVRRIDRRATVVAASTTTRYPSVVAYLPKYLAALRAVKWPLDVFSVHVYPAANAGPAARRAQLQTAQAALVAARAPRKPLWDTEINYGLPGVGLKWRPIGGDLASAYVARTFLDSLRLGVARTYWYAWTPTTGYLGVRMFTGTPGAAGFTTTRSWLVGSIFRGCTGTTVVVCRFTKGKASFVVAWTEKGTARYLPARGTRTACSVTGRACVALRPRQAVTLTAVPVKLG